MEGTVLPAAPAAAATAATATAAPAAEAAAEAAEGTKAAAEVTEAAADVDLGLCLMFTEPLIRSVLNFHESTGSKRNQYRVTRGWLGVGTSRHG